MILCEWNGNWYICTGIDRTKGGCWLRCGPKMPHPHNFKPLPPVGAVLYGNTPEVDSVVFYPSLYSNGWRVEPIAWDRDSSEPILRCFLDAGQLGRMSEQEYRETVRVLREDGWHWDQRDGGEKYIHVNELERIKGPPPDGEF
jgi:hypothetical protein